MEILRSHSLERIGAFFPESNGLTEAEKDGQITLTLDARNPPAVGIGSWIRDDTEPGKGIVYRIKSVETDYRTGTMTLTAEHIINVLKDTALFGEIGPADMGGSETECTCEQAARYALGRQNDWQLGGIGYSVSAGYGFNGDSVFEALEQVSSTLESPWWSYDLNVYPFKLYILPRETTAACEMREGRNLTSLRRSVDASRMYTRIYPIGKDNLHIAGEYLEMNTEIYGVISRVQTDQSKESEGDLRIWAQERLRKHAEPAVSIQISGLELAEDTGEELDRLKLGRGCRAPLPEWGATILETIVKIAWRDKIKDPETCTVTLANEIADVASIIRQERSEGSGSSGRGGRGAAKKAGEDHAWFVDTDEHVGMVAEAVAGEGAAADWSRVAQVIVDGKGIHQRVTEAQGDIITQQTLIEQNQDRISLGVQSRVIGSSMIHQYGDKSSFPTTGQAGHYYYDQQHRQWYMWAGSGYVAAVVHQTTDQQGNPVYSGSNINIGEIVTAVNSSTGEIETKIDADKVFLGRMSDADRESLQALADEAGAGTGIFAKYLTVDTLTANLLKSRFAEISGQLELGGSLKIANGDIELSGDIRGASYIGGDIGSFSESLDVAGHDLSNPVMTAEVDGNTLTLTNADGTTTTFSKATRLIGSWEDGTLEVAATQTNAGTTEEVATESFVTFPAYKVLGGENFGVSMSAWAHGRAYTDQWLAEMHLESHPDGANSKTVAATPDGVWLASISNADTYNSGVSSGWSLARQQVSVPQTAGTAASFTVKVPAYVQGNQDTYTYTLQQSPYNDNMVLCKTAAGTVVARVTHGKYTAGYNAGWGKAAAMGSAPSTSGTGQYITVSYPPTTVDGAKIERKYYVTGSSTSDIAYIRLNSASGITVAQINHGAYSQGKADGAAGGEKHTHSEVITYIGINDDYDAYGYVSDTLITANKKGATRTVWW